MSAPGFDEVTTVGSLWVPGEQQWLSTSQGRCAPDGYSWMQAVHWVASAGVYVPRRKHGPKEFGRTTVWIAQLVSELWPCRPGIEYLVRRTGLSDRTVQYHLEMLRQAGLLAYVSRGTRVAGQRPEASVFAQMIPVEFDVALGVRTAGEGPQRRMTGLAESGRHLMAKLAKKASRRAGKPRAKTPSRGRRSVSGVPDSTGERCTPMGGGSSTLSTTGTTPCPSESELASGQQDSSPRKRPRAEAPGKPRTPNRVAQRFRLASQLVRQVPWLRSAALPRIAWVVSEVSDAGWTVEEVLTCLGALMEEPPGGTRRPSGLLASRLRGMTTMPGWATPQQRAAQVAHRETAVDAARRADIARVRDGRDLYDGADRLPAAATAQREWQGAVDRVRHQAASGRQVLEDFAVGEDGLADLAQLSRGEVADLRAAAQTNPALIESMIDACGEPFARRLFSNQLVDQVLKPAGRSNPTASYQVWRAT